MNKQMLLNHLEGSKHKAGKCTDKDTGKCRYERRIKLWKLE